MGRLIDADDVMEMLTNIELSCAVIPITEAKLRLRDIPTAYDVDKVVEELEERQKEYLAGFGVHNNDEMYGVACGLGDAIKIVNRKYGRTLRR